MNNKLFTIGPVEMYQSTKEVRLNGFVHFRTDEFSEIVKNSLSRLSKLLGNSKPNSLIYLAASGTAAMEATVENCVSENDKVLVINGGAFGKRFCELLNYHNKNYNSVNLNWNETLTYEHLKPFENQNYTMLFVNLHETQTGQLYDVKMLSDFCKKNNMMFVVDAISTFLADDYDMEKFEIDLTIISSQKGLCLSPGMSFVSFSKRMLEKIENMPLLQTKYFDFKDYLKNIPRGQTPYTPPVLVMYELEDMLNLIDKEGGKDARLKAVKAKCDYFRRKAKENNIGLLSIIHYQMRLLHCILMMLMLMKLYRF
ncbi:MAG: aminotransferase class V-fold PLP-dependent enzyme [Candidatus Gastranaerophilales bacterium]|nr:aminotransferase class V-fold PLP-dependent enzyme [Candidatus Gastranaerophilales bacterium]